MRRIPSAIPLLLLAAAAGACADREPTAPGAPAVEEAAIKFWEAGSSVGWNATARATMTARAVAAPHVTLRILTYLSIAQHNAIVAADQVRGGGAPPSAAAAAGAASAVVLSWFFPLDAASFEATLDQQLAAPGWPGEERSDRAAGEAIGREVGAEVVAYAATDNFNVAQPPAAPVGPEYWTSSTNPATPPIKALFGTRPFFMTSEDQFRPPPPPAFGSPDFLADLAEIRQLSDTRTADQLAQAQYWAAKAAPYLNEVAAELIESYRRSEREAAHILAYANMAAFDAMIACWDAKFAYWLVRPSGADPAITLPIGLPNHPSFTSGHSCNTASFARVLDRTFPAERERLEEMVIAAGLSRMYGGLHYRFDCEVGQDLGRQAADWALAADGGVHAPIALD
jgi:hypothetical protein